MKDGLVIELKRKEKTFASVYYHWSLSTLMALEEVKIILTALKDVKFSKYEDEEWKVIKIFEFLGGGLSKESEEMYKNLYPHRVTKQNVSLNINEGLMDITEKGIEKNRELAGGIIVIDIEQQTINNGVFFYWEFDPRILFTNAQLYSCEYNPQKIPFKNLDAVIDEIRKMKGRFLKVKGCYLEIIEE